MLKREQSRPSAEGREHMVLGRGGAGGGGEMVQKVLLSGSSAGSGPWREGSLGLEGADRLC